MKIEINKKYKTRSKLEYICYWVGDGKAHGAIIDTLGERQIVVHNDNGRYFDNGDEYPLDLIEVKEKKQLTGFVNIDKDGHSGLWDTLDDAIESEHVDIVARLDLSQYGIFYEEGEGL